MINIAVPIIEDFEEINKIAKQIHDLHVLWRPDKFISVEQPIQKEYFSKLIENKEIYAAKENNKILGYVITSMKEKKIYGFYDRKAIVIDVIVVDEYCQNGGIGKQLVEFITELGKKEQCTEIYLTVNEENTKAIEFYEKLGMRVNNISYSMRI